MIRWNDQPAARMCLCSNNQFCRVASCRVAASHPAEHWIKQHLSRTYLVWISCSSSSSSSSFKNCSAFARSIEDSLPSSLDMLLQGTKGCRCCCCTMGGGWKPAYTECVSRSEQLPTADQTSLLTCPYMCMYPTLTLKCLLVSRG